MDPSSLAWELTAKRWLRVGFLTAAATFAAWILWEMALPQSSWGSSIAAATRFFLFQIAQLLFLLGQRLVVRPEDPSPSSIGDTVLGMFALARAALGSSLDVDYTQIVVQKVRVLRNNFVLAVAAMASGFLSLCALTLSVKKARGSFALDMGVRGAGLGLCYILLYMWGKGHLLKFPIIQRQVYFSMKLGLAIAFRSALRIAVISIPVAEILVRFLHRFFAGEWGPFSLWHQIIYVIGAFFVAVVWNLCCHFIQVIHTRRFAFAPPPGSAAAETNPTEPLFSVLEDDDNLIQQYLGYLDLFIVSGVSEINFEAWRRAAFFEESGEIYKKVIARCLRPLDRLTSRLSKKLESQFGSATKDRAPAADLMHSSENFQELQLCSWCASIIASLTAFSRSEDRYGVAQLTGSNAAVLSSLISCLLVLDICLGRRRTWGILSLASPSGVRWGVPFRGALLDVDGNQSSIFRKNSLQHKKAQVLADVLRTSIYKIVVAFRDEMAVSSSGSVSYALAERDWLSRNKPLFGTPEMHLQRLGEFIEFQA